LLSIGACQEHNFCDVEPALLHCERWGIPFSRRVAVGAPPRKAPPAATIPDVQIIQGQDRPAPTGAPALPCVVHGWWAAWDTVASRTVYPLLAVTFVSRLYLPVTA
jgi:hypothetical protein